MQVTVEYGAQVRRAAGVASEPLELAEGSVEELFRRVCEKHGPGMRELLFNAEEKPRPSILVFAGDRQIRPGEPLPLQEGLTITLLSPISGG